MKRIMMMLLSVMLFCSCEVIEGEGRITAQNYDVSDEITKIDISAALDLELVDYLAPGEIEIETYGNIFQYINVSTSSNQVAIWLDKKRYASDLDIKIFASAAQYNSVEASGASRVKLTGNPTAATYEIDLSGASSFAMSSDFGYLDLLEVEFSGASRAEIRGAAQECSVELSGASTVDGKDLLCEELFVQLSGASNLKIGVEKSAQGNLSGASRLYYKGNPVLDVETSGSSLIKEL